MNLLFDGGFFRAKPDSVNVQVNSLLDIDNFTFLLYYACVSTTNTLTATSSFTFKYEPPAVMSFYQNHRTIKS